MILRLSMLSVFVPMVLASVGCTGSGQESYSDEDGITDSDDSIALSTDEEIGSSIDHLMMDTPICPEAAAADDCDGGGGGYTPPPPPSPPPVNTTASYLDANAKAYLSQAGVPDAGTVGATMWVNACKVSAQQGSVTFNSGVTNTCVWANTYPGWIVLETGYEVLRNKNGRGSASVSSMNGSVTISTLEFGSKFNGAISLANSAKDASAEAKLQWEYQRLNGYSYSFSGTGNNVVALVKANGGLFQASDIEIQAKAKLLRVY